jgi:hypothetical protein
VTQKAGEDQRLHGLLPVYTTRRALPYGLPLAGVVGWCEREGIPHEQAYLVVDTEYDEQGPEIFAEWEVPEGQGQFAGYTAQSSGEDQGCDGPRGVT